ncbi:MAG TPA: diguanylate cyclase [Acidimicrobiales bacterium]
MTARILVVSPSADVRATLVDQLALARQHDVAEVAGAADASAALDAAGVALVLLDVATPSADALVSRDVPVLAVASNDDGASPGVTRALAAGALDVVRLPVATPDLHARVAAALRLSIAERDARSSRVQAEEAARTDHLTGLANRRHLDEHLVMASSAARRQRQDLGLLLVDVDHLRRVNDTVGHQGGNDVLRAVARRISGLLRGEDMAGRWGGEEFLVVAPATDLDGAWRLGERIRDAVSSTPVALGGGREVMVTLSVGCAVGDGGDDHLRRVEAALEEAKSAGRNRVVADVSIVR